MDSPQFEQPLSLRRNNSQSINFNAFLALDASRQNSPEDKSHADFIQYYGLSAIRCFQQEENPAIALMALMPFRLGKFCLANELHAILFADPSHHRASIERFEKRLDKILNSIDEFHQNAANDAYLIQTTIGLQVLVQAALKRIACSTATLKQQEEHIRKIHQKLTSLRTPRASEVTTLPYLLCDTLLSAPRPSEEEGLTLRVTFNSLLATETLNFKPYSHSFVHEAGRVESENFMEEPFSPEKVRQIFTAACQAAEKGLCADAFGDIDKVVNTLKHKGISFNDSLFQFPELQPILNYLSRKDSSPAEYFFALWVVDKLFEGEISTTPLNRRRGINPKITPFFNTLLKLEAHNPQSAYVIGKIFVHLTNYSGNVHRHSFGLLPEYLSLQREKFLPSEEGSKDQRVIRNDLSEISLFLLLSSVLVVVAYFTVLPLMPIYIAAAVLFCLALVSTGANVFLINRQVLRLPRLKGNLEEPLAMETIPSQIPSSQEFIKADSSLEIWLNAYGYDRARLLQREFIGIFKKFPLLCDSINVRRDFEVFRSFLQNGEEDIFNGLGGAFRGNAKFRALLIYDPQIFKQVVTTIDQVDILIQCAKHPNSAAQEITYRQKIWNIIQGDDNYFRHLIAAGCEWSLDPSLDQSRGLQPADNGKPDPYEKLKAIFPDKRGDIDTIRARMDGTTGFDPVLTQPNVSSSRPDGNKLVGQEEEQLGESEMFSL